MDFRKHIAREWLILVVGLFLGFFLAFAINYFNSKDFKESRHIIYTLLTNELHLHIGSFEEFSIRLDNLNDRRMFYDTLCEKYDLGNYETFVEKITRSRSSKAFHSIINSQNLLQTLMLVLAPYVLVQFTRTLLWSIKVLKKK
jgi:hypothetical protein